MIKARNVFRDSPVQLEEAEKNYYVFMNGSVWYENWKKKNKNEIIDSDIKKYKSRLTNIHSLNKRKNKDVEQDDKISSYMNDLERLYKEKISKEILKQEGTTEKYKIAERLSYYEDKNRILFEKVNHIMFILYCLFLVFYIFTFIYVHEEYKDKTLLMQRGYKVAFWILLGVIWRVLYLFV